MLSIIGSIASIIGLSIQVYQEFISKNPGVLGQYMGLLIIVTDTSQCWKNIHHKYQSISNDLEAIRRNIISSDGLSVRVKQPSEIAPNTIRNIFESDTLQDAVFDFSEDLQVAFEPLREASRLSKDEQNGILRDIGHYGRNDLAVCIKNVAVLQKQTVEIHDDFCLFLSQIKGFLSKENWGEAEIGYLVKHRAVFMTRFDKNIKNADGALINLMDIMKIVVDEARAKKG